MRRTCWLVFIVALVASLLGCDASESDSEHDVDADVDSGRRDAGRSRTGNRAVPGDQDSSVRPEMDAGRPSRVEDAGADVGKPTVRDAEPDADGGAEEGAGGIRYDGGDGSSCEQAVVILGAKSEFEGIGAEYDWLGRHYPGSEVLEQALGQCDGHWADILSIRTAQGESREVYFDIEEFFGT